LVESDPNDYGAANIAEILFLTLRNIGGLIAVHESMARRGKVDAPIRITIETLPVQPCPAYQYS
jgi:hypothetical protein